MDVVVFLLYAITFYILYRMLDYFYRMPTIGSLSNRYILVTGCDTGFGHDISKRLDKRGCHVFATCLTEAGETELRKTCSSRLKALHMNVSEPESIRKAFDIVKKTIPNGSGLWGIVNNAGISGHFGPVEWLSINDYRKVFDVNLFGLMDTTMTFLPLLKKENGRIVNTASAIGRLALTGFPPYCVSKYGVEGFSDLIRRQLHDYGVSVHLIEPGFFKTPLTNVERLTAVCKQSWNQCPDDIREEYGEDYLEGFIEEVLNKFVGGIVSDRVEEVVDGYEHALLAKYPRDRYLIGRDTKFLWIPVSYLPEWMGDGILRLLAGKRRPMPRILKKNL